MRSVSQLAKGKGPAMISSAFCSLWTKFGYPEMRYPRKKISPEISAQRTAWVADPLFGIARDRVGNRLTSSRAKFTQWLR